MNFLDYFEDELNNKQTNYFIFDTKSNNEKWDKDFELYSWETNKFNKVKEGDLFIYRRPKNASENNMFYFFGIGKIKNIAHVNDSDHPTKVSATVSKPYPLPDYINQNDLEEFEWEWKPRKTTFKDNKEVKTWEHFFNQYGMNLINKNDFINLISISDINTTLNDYNPDIAINDRIHIDNQDYSSENKDITTSGRQGHTPFANDVKRNYSNQCAICNLSTKTFLVASHIIPWSKDKHNRLNPANGICLCTLHDKMFDKGYITIDDQYKIKMTDKKITDNVLAEQLLTIHSQKINLPKVMKPSLEFLEYHRENIFNTFK